MNAITTFEHGTPEYTRLEKAAAILTAASDHGTVYSVEDTYFDFGQKWMFTTLIAHRTNGDSYQALSPIEQEDLLCTEDLFEAVRKVTNGYSWTHYLVDCH